jgi:hypothetical protein
MLQAEDFSLETFDSLRVDCGYRPAALPSPERSLLLAMLAQAANDLQRCRASVSGRAQRTYAEAYRWVMSNDRSHAFSFVNICEALRLSPVALRAGMVVRPRSPRFPKCHRA